MANTLIYFSIGAIAGVFITLMIIQFFTGTSISVNGAVPEADNPSRFWTCTLTYLGCGAGALVLILLY